MKIKNRPERLTSQKLIILEWLKNTKSHPSPEMVYDKVKKQLPHISLATVYRNLKNLKNNELIQEIPFLGSIRYDGNTSSHAHFICDKCKQIYDVFERCSLTKPHSIKVGKVEKYKICLYGKCKKCS